MVLVVQPEVGIAMSDIDDTDKFVPTLEAAAATAKLLAEAGLGFFANGADLDDAAETVRQAARNPTKLQTPAAINAVFKKTPASLILTQEILDEFGDKIVEEAERVRNLVTNKLIQETENPDARVRLKALELLGKVSDVGLFNEKREITVTHQTTDDVKARLRNKLERMLTTVKDVSPQDPDAITDAEIVEEGEADE